jgi:hypothetical protein
MRLEGLGQLKKKSTSHNVNFSICLPYFRTDDHLMLLREVSMKFRTLREKAELGAI